MFPFNSLSLNEWISLDNYLVHGLQLNGGEFEKGVYASVWSGVIASASSKNRNMWFVINNLSFRADFVEKYMVEFEKEGNAPVWLGVMPP